jgi:A/G-specific adenine glycosylase
MKAKDLFIIFTISSNTVSSFLFKTLRAYKVHHPQHLSRRGFAVSTASWHPSINSHRYKYPLPVLRMTASSSKEAEEKKSEDLMVETKRNHLWDFATHTSASYHDFAPEEAAAIRSALLTWYRANRRKLPWRGDEGPFTGSTAGIATSTTKKENTNNKNANANQKDITSFFGKTKQVNKKSSRTRTSTRNGKIQKDEEQIIEKIPVTGYSVWVSEIMLQQTRVEAVIKYYLKWMERFPTVQDLASATEDEVNAHWAGLGFYRRARLLHQGAKYVVEELDGEVPDTVEELLKVSGIGRYTASAIASIAFDKCVPVVDGNVCRVISRLKGVANNIKAPVFKDRLGWQLAEQIVKAGDGMHAGEVNQALMELGATYCAPSGTGVHEDDPLVKFYLSTKIGIEVDELLKNDSFAVSDFVSSVSLARGSSSCPLCEEGGISNVLFQLADDVLEARNDPGQSNCAATIGHSKFPTPPPRKAKREEILSVSAISHVDSSGCERWFMIKRPVDGLLGKFFMHSNLCFLVRLFHAAQ